MAPVIVGIGALVAELRGPLTAEQATRWAEVKAAYVRTQALGGPEDGQLARAVGALALLAERIAAVESAISRTAGPGHLVTDRTARTRRVLPPEGGTGAAQALSDDGRPCPARRGARTQTKPGSGRPRGGV